MNKLIYILFPFVALFVLACKCYEKQVENEYLDTMKKAQERLDVLKKRQELYTKLKISNQLKQEQDKSKARKKKKRK